MSVYKGVRYSRLGVDVLEADVVQYTGYAVADLPPAEAWEGALLYVTDGAEGDPIMAFSDGTNWLRCDTRAEVSTE